MNAKRALALFAAYIGTQVAVAIVVAGVTLLYSLSLGYRSAEVWRAAMVVGAPIGFIAAGACVFWLARRMLAAEPEGLRSIGWMRTTPLKQAVAAIVGLALGVLFVGVVMKLFPLPPDVKVGPMEQVASGGGWKLYVLIVVAIFIGPPVEELVFRGVMWTGLSRSWGTIPAAIVVTALFVALHLLEAGRYPPAIVAIAISGVAMLVARVVTGSLAAPIAMHMAYNAVIALGMLREYG